MTHGRVWIRLPMVSCFPSLSTGVWGTTVTHPYLRVSGGFYGGRLLSTRCFVQNIKKRIVRVDGSDQNTGSSNQEPQVQGCWLTGSSNQEPRVQGCWLTGSSNQEPWVQDC